jgi:hypothetical protein
VNAAGILKHEHLWVYQHLASFECVLVDVFNSSLGDPLTPTLDRYRTLSGDDFNAIEVGHHKNDPVAAVLKEYDGTQVQTTSANTAPRSLCIAIGWAGNRRAADVSL